MWIFLGIVLFIALLITVILLLPIYLIIKTDESGELIIRYKVLFKTFGEEPDPNNPIVLALKDISGVTRLDKERLKQSAKNGNLHSTLKESFFLVTGLLKRLLELLKFCKIRVLKIKIVCAENDAAHTALTYGNCYTFLAPFLSFVHTKMKVREKGEDVNITCNFQSSNDLFQLETVIAVRVFRVLVALFRAGYDEATRVAKEQEIQRSDS